VHRIGRTGRVGRTGVAITLAEPREHRLLRNIEALTQQKIEVAALPTMADLHARRLDLLQGALRERVVAGEFEDVRVVVESLAQEFDIVDVAMAAVKMAQAAIAAADQKAPAAADSETAFSAGRGRRPVKERTKSFPSRPQAQTRLYIGGGRQMGMRPADLVGAITGEAGINSRALGAIEIADRFSLIEVPQQAADTIIEALRGTNIRGRKVTVRRERATGRAAGALQGRSPRAKEKKLRHRRIVSF
jgi:ATP-dependent RNA helicase DeaD